MASGVPAAWRVRPRRRCRAGSGLAGEVPVCLGALRGEWQDTAQSAGEAVAEWGAAARGRRPIAVGREAYEPDPQQWEQYSNEVAQLRETLRAVPLDDHATWARVARETAGAFAAWSTATETVPGPLAAAATELSKTAQLRRYPVKPVRTIGPSACGASLLLMAATAGSGTAAQAIMLRQLLSVSKAIHDMHQANNDLRRSRQINTMVRTQYLRRHGFTEFPQDPPVKLPGEGSSTEHHLNHKSSQSPACSTAAPYCARVGTVEITVYPARHAGRKAWREGARYGRNT